LFRWRFIFVRRNDFSYIDWTFKLLKSFFSKYSHYSKTQYCVIIDAEEKQLGNLLKLATFLITEYVGIFSFYHEATLQTNNQKEVREQWNENFSFPP